MDPYLEARWSNVHSTLITAIQDALQPALPPGLRARAEERVLLEDVGGEPLKQYRSDVAVVESRGGAATAVAEAAVVVPEPYVIDFHDGPQIDRFVQIIDLTNRSQVVTAIEVLSPWNKAPGRLSEEYRRKIIDYARASVSVVEIDLLRSPRTRLRVTHTELPPERRTPYLVAVSRGWNPARWEAYSIGLRGPLPPIRVPLRRDDPDVVLQLQPLIERVYVSGGHDDIDYSKPPVPSLSVEDAAWAEQFLKEWRPSQR